MVMNSVKNELKSTPELSLPEKDLFISIGIVAYNESEWIGRMLNSLFEQSLFNQSLSDQSVAKLQLELIVLPNGCTDDTAEVARQAIASAVDPSTHKNLEWDVREIAQASKGNAWNLFVHEFSSRKAQYLFLMDSDIQLLNPNTLSSMLKTFEQSPARVVVDKPIKDVVLKPEKTLREHLSAAVSGLSGGRQATVGGPAWICGQLYCAEAKALRQIWLPTTLPAQDSFLYTMIVTDSLQTGQHPERVILAGSASHAFEAYTSMKRLLKHERWLISANAVNELLFSNLKATGMVGSQAGTYIMQNNLENPQWLSHLIQTAAARRRWLIPRFILTRRFSSLTHKSWYKAAVLFPLTLAAFLIDLYLAIQVNQELHQGAGLGYWGKHD